MEESEELEKGQGQIDNCRVMKVQKEGIIKRRERFVSNTWKEVGGGGGEEQGERGRKWMERAGGRENKLGL